MQIILILVVTFYLIAKDVDKLGKWVDGAYSAFSYLSRLPPPP